MSAWNRSTRIVAAYAVVTGVVLVGTSAFLLYIADVPLLSGRVELVKGVLFVLVSSALLHALLHRVPRPVADVVDLFEESRALSMRRLAPLFLVLALAVPAISLAVYLLNSAQETEESMRDMESAAALKASQIESWLTERRSDAAVLVASEGFVERATRWLDTGDPGEQALAENRLTLMHAYYEYEAVELYGADGRRLFSTDPSLPPAPGVPAFGRQALDSGTILFGELSRGETRELHRDFVAPLLRRDGSTQDVLAVVVLHMNPGTFLQPLLKYNPSRIATARYFLAYRNGDSIIAYGEERPESNGDAPVRRLPATSRIPEAVAVRADGPGVMQGEDHRGVSVIAAYRPVAGTDWWLVARMDRGEAIAPAHKLALWVSIISLAALAAVLLAALALVRAQQRAQRLALYDQNTRLQKQFFDLPFIGMAITAPESKHWLQFNDRLCDMFGYTREELAQKTWAEMTHPDDLAADVHEFQRVMSGASDGYVLDKRFLRKDGSILYTTIDIKCLRRADGSVENFICVVYDITARKAAEARAQLLMRLNDALSRVNSAIVHCADEQSLFSDVCRIAVEQGGMKMAWVGMVHAASGLVQPVANFGSGVKYLEGIVISVHGDHPQGQGPTGTSIREGHPCVCQDFQNDPVTAPWHERARRFGWGASASLPLRRAGVPVGALTLYAGTAYAFDPRTQALLEEMAQDISFALDNLDRELARRQAEQALSDSEKRYRAIIESSLDAILLSAPDGRILAANDAACRMFQRSEEEIVAGGRNLVVDMDDPRVPAALEERARTGKFRGELTFLRGSGEKFPGEATSVLFEDSNGELRTSMIVRDIGERKRAEELTLALTEQLSFYLEASPVVSYALALGGTPHPVWVSDNIARMTGYTVEEAVHPNWWSRHLHPDDRDSTVSAFRQSLQDAGAHQHEYRFLHKAGHYLWILDSFRIVSDDSGRAVQVVGAWHDITEQRTLKDALQVTEERFRIIFEQAPLGIALIDSLSGQIYEINPKFAAIAGRTPEQMRDISWQTITHPDDVQADLDNMAQLNTGRIPGYSMKKRYLRPDGSAVWIHMTIAPIRTPSADARPRHLCLIEDITENERMLDALADQESRFRALAEQSLVGIYVFEQGKLSYMNPRAADIFGYTPQEVVGIGAKDVVAESDLARVEGSIQSLMDGATQDVQMEFTGRRKDGGMVEVGAHGRIAQVGNRRVLMGVLQDITEKRRAEASIRDYIARIERMIAGTVDAMSTVIELRDPYTAGHERRVGELSSAIAAEMGLDEDTQHGLRLAGAVHDVGKIAVPAEILSKPGRLTPLEYELVKGHAQQGYEVLRGIDSPWPIAEVARQHHERMDGSGYPRGLKGEEILLEARILAVADVVESMGSHRPYRATLGVEKALDEIERNAGSLYDARVVAACLRLFRESNYVLPP